ncbi:MAG TPA: cytochrome c3 family protein [Candidatus Desulfaltia sp.]|nr:cytochrome c3 family protein [Candidatus Desulfaltia sp.]
MPLKLSFREAKRRSHLVVFVSSLMFLPISLSAQKNSCVDCHLQMEDALKAPAENFAADVHKQYGLSCQDCHGGNPAQEDIELAKDRSFKGAPDRARVPEFCGSCHSDSAYMRKFNPNLRIDQLTLYWSSRHGQLLKKGDAKVAVCTDCHGVHGIQSANFPKSQTFPWNIPQTCGRCHDDSDYMKAYTIPTGQVEEYKQSVHANALYEKKDLSAPVCNDCHGNHGAVPPEVTSIAFVCRQCHPSAGDLFSQSPHKEAFDALGMSECEACHGDHKITPPSDEMLAGGKDDICLQCHDPGTGPHETGLKIKKQIDDFVASSETARALLAEAEKRGVEVSEALFKLGDATTALVLARNLTHGLSPAEIEVNLDEGIKALSEVRVRGEEALREASFRRSGLVIATVFILLLAVALYLKIRDLKRS